MNCLCRDRLVDNIPYALIASEKGILSRIAGLKEVKKKAKVQSRKGDPGIERRKGRKK